MGEARTFIVTDDDDGIRLDRWFKRNLPEATFNIVSRWARTGQLRVNGEDEAQFVRDMVIYQDANAFVFNKPPGLATQGGTKTHNHLDRLLDGLADEGGRPKLVHRLDKDTSGALLVARSARAAGHFAKAFSGRTARKV